VDATQPAPFPDGELSLTHDLREFRGRVELLGISLLNQQGQGSFDAIEALL
jgi:hypothetical protein